MQTIKPLFPLIMVGDCQGAFSPIYSGRGRPFFEIAQQYALEFEKRRDNSIVQLKNLVSFPIFPKPTLITRVCKKCAEIIFLLCFSRAAVLL